MLNIEKHLISAQKLNDTRNVVILDATFRLPNDPLNAYEEYIKQHIPEAHFFDIPAISDKTSNLPNMLPSEQHFEEYMNVLGITNNDKIVVYGQTGMIMGPARAWWMFKTFGHQDVQILDGGLPVWLSQNLKTSNQETTKTHKGRKYNAKLSPKNIATITSVQNAINDETTAIIDARSPKRYSGENKEPRKGLKSGHIPTSINLPCSLFINETDTTLKPIQEIQEILKPHLSPNIITTCGSGVTACFLKYILTLTEHDSVKVYDGSWSEWGQISLNLPITQIK